MWHVCVEGMCVCVCSLIQHNKKEIRHLIVAVTVRELFTPPLLTFEGNQQDIHDRKPILFFFSLGNW